MIRKEVFEDTMKLKILIRRLYQIIRVDPKCNHMCLTRGQEISHRGGGRDCGKATVQEMLIGAEAGEAKRRLCSGACRREQL